MEKNINTVAGLILVLGLGATMSVAASSDFQKWMQQQKSDFQEYKDKRDKEFTAFLKNNWKEMQLLKGVERDKKPKPVAMPVAKPVPVPKREPVVISPDAPKPVTVTPPAISTVPVPSTTPVSQPKPPVKPQPVKKPEPIVSKPVTGKPAPVVVAPPPVSKPVVSKKPVRSPARKGRKLSVDYFGDSITVYYDSKLRVPVSGRISKQLISDTWSKLSLADFEPLVEQLVDIRKQRELNDWAFAVLVDRVSSKIAPAGNSRDFLNWFILIKADYEARIAYDASNIHLLLPTQQPLYAVPYFTLDGIRFYAVDFDGRETRLGRVFTYDGKYPGADQALDMRLTSDMIEARRTQSRALNFKFDGKAYSIKANYDKERVDFLNTYPQLDLDMYFAAKVADSSAMTLHSQLAKHIEGMSQLEAVNFLMRFVQTSLKYKTDDGQFGKENYLFPEETLHYRYSDCEDRSVLFAWLVRNLLGLEVVGLDYPGHVAAAVHFTEKVSGDSVMYKGKRFTVTDPTYINAVAGMTMPEYRGKRPKVITIN